MMIGGEKLKNSRGKPTPVHFPGLNPGPHGESSMSVILFEKDSDFIYVTMTKKSHGSYEYIQETC
jgi:hypothetical protein